MKTLSLFSLMVTVSLYGFDSWGQSAGKDYRPLWRKIGSQVSKILPSGRGSLELDFDTEDGDAWRTPLAGTTHVVSFSPVYLATALVETALSPVWLLTNGMTEFSEGTTEKSGNKAVEEENRKLREENAELKRKEKELLDKLKDQAEKFFDSYNPDTKIGIVGPELKKYFDESRPRLLALYSETLLALGAPRGEVAAQASLLNQQVNEINLAKYILMLGNRSI